MFLLESKLGGILDVPDALICRNEQLNALSSVVYQAGTAGNENVQSRLYAPGEQLKHLHRQRAVRDQLLDREVGARMRMDAPVHPGRAEG